MGRLLAAWLIAVRLTKVPITEGATSAGAPDPVVSELAPAGILRAGMNLSNALFTMKDAATGELRGVSVDLMRELAARLGVLLEFAVYATPGEVADAVDSGKWDVAILAIEPARAQKIAFSPAMTEIEATYLVHEDSDLRSVEQVDRPGIRVCASEKAGYELYLTRTLRSAELIRTKGLQAALDLFNGRGADAAAGLRPALLESTSKVPDARLLEGNFMTVNHGIGTPRERRVAAEYVKAFVEEMIASGFVARSIERHDVQGLSAVK